jgi:hypothetical protein
LFGLNVAFISLNATDFAILHINALHFSILIDLNTQTISVAEGGRDALVALSAGRTVR